jgi:dephospho-CoA kinase
MLYTKSSAMKRIGITGSIGSGKSTVTNIFKQLGVPVYDADSRAKMLMVNSPSLIAGTKSLFGEEAYLPSGELNRQLISSKAFHNQNLLTQLNGLVHPAVYTDFEDWCAAQNAPYVIKEAALMFESDSYKQLNEIIVVTAPEEIRIERASQRDGVTREAILSRMKNQFSQEEKLARGQYEIKNDEQMLLIPQVLHLHNLFING